MYYEIKAISYTSANNNMNCTRKEIFYLTSETRSVIVPDFRSKMKKMVLNHLIKHHFYLLWR